MILASFLWLFLYTHFVWPASFKLFTIVFIVFVINPASSSVAWTFVFFRVGVFTGAFRFTINWHWADDPVLGCGGTAISAVPPAVFVVVDWVTQTISDICFPATGYTLQIGGVWIPVKFRSPYAPYHYSPLNLVSLWNEKIQKVIFWWSTL